jgi:hypothetical protein
MLLLGAINDSVVSFKDIQKIYKIYKGDKQFVHLECDHSENRSRFILEQIRTWIKELIQNDVIDKEQF